jgi:hypothetical protein
MQPKIALAIGGAALAIPSTALAAATHNSQHSPVPGHEALRASGHMTRDAAAVRRIHTREHRRRRARHHRHHLAHRSTASAPLQAIAVCESGGNPSANTGNGFYGKYQFTMGTWASVGGRGNPAAASEAEQDRRAAMLYARAGSSPWPVCGR